MARYREEMKKYYYDPTKYKTYLEQLGVELEIFESASSTSPFFKGGLPEASLKLMALSL